MDDYPTDEQLKEIECWPHKDFIGLAEFVVSIWNYGHPWATLKGKKVKTLRLATGGWSGNENIIDALGKNLLFWSVCWQKSSKGGAYVFKIKSLTK